MQKVLLYNDSGDKTELFAAILKKAIPSAPNGELTLKIANYTTHGLARIYSRRIRPNQEIILGQVKKELITFKASDVSEIRGIKLATGLVVTGIVVNDVVFAVHSLNMPNEIRRMGFGTREGVGFSVLKTALERPNKQPPFFEIDGYKILR